jgi:hypothetical protein
MGRAVVVVELRLELGARGCATNIRHRNRREQHRQRSEKTYALHRFTPDRPKL